MVEGWLSSIHFEEYVVNFLEAGYDLPTISRMTPEDLIAIAITNPVHRKKIKHEITRLSVPDGIPAVIPESLYEWLYLLRLEEYFDLLRKQGYDSVEKVAELTWEDFEEIGIKKLGHQKRLSLAIKRCNTFVKEGGSGSGICGSGLGSPSDAPGSTIGSHYSSTTTFSNGIGGGAGGSVSVNGSFSDMMMLHSHQLDQQHHGHLPPRPASQLGMATSTPSFRPIVLNSENNFVDFDGTATLQRHQRAAIVGSAVSFLSKGPNAGPKPVAMIAAKSRGSCGSVDKMGGVGDQSQLQDLVNEMKKHHQLSNGGYTQQQPHQPLVGGGHHHRQAPLSTTASTSSLVSAASLTSCDASESASLYGVMMPRHNYCQQQQLNSYDSNSSIYATLKRGKRPPPPPPKRTNSMKSSSSTSSIIIPPSQSCGNSSVGSPAASCVPANGVTSTFPFVHTRSVNGNHAANHNQHLHQYQQEQNYSPGSTIDPYTNYNDSSSTAQVGGQRLYGMVGQYNHYQNQQRIAPHQPNNPNVPVDENEDEPPPPPAPHPTSLMPPQHQLHPRSLVDDFQDQAFATCVKSLTSRFSQMSTAADDESPPGMKFFNPPLPSSSTSTPSTSSSKPSPSSSSHHTSSSQETLPPPPPPLPPTRVESIQSSTSPGNHNRHPSSSSLSGRGGGDFGGSCEFPPPPTPLRQSVEDLSQLPASHHISGDKNSNLETFKTFPLWNNNNSSNMTNNSNNACNIRIIKNIQRNGNNNKNNIIINSPDEKSSSPCGSTSSSSSNESLPFANDKVGTIRQSASSHHASSSYSSVNPQSLNCLNGIGPQPSTPNSTFKPQQHADLQQQRKMETIESLAATLMSMKAAGQNGQGPASPASSCSSNDSKASSSSSSSNSSSSAGSSSPLSSKIEQFARRYRVVSLLPHVITMNH